jgi:predicted ribosome quality control (RQC) complex YloA/Tae2 family protein
MKECISQNGTKILIGRNAKENDTLTLNADPSHHWMHVSNVAGSHIVICSTSVDEQTKRDAAALAVKYSCIPRAKKATVDFCKAGQVRKSYKTKHHGLVEIVGDYTVLTVFINKEQNRFDRLL